MSEHQDLIVWVVLAVLFAVTEMATIAFVALYLAIGASVAAVLAGLDVDVVWQVLAFIVVGAVLMAITRPFLKNHLQTPPVLMNVDRMNGKRGVVTIPIDNDANTGQIRVGTEYWTARMDDEFASATLAVDAAVTILRVAGVTAYIAPVTTATSPVTD